MRTDVRLPSRVGCHSGSQQSGESGGTISPLLFVFFVFFFFFFFMGEPEVTWAALEPGTMPNSRRLALVSAAARGVGG